MANDIRRGEVILIAFPFIAEREVQPKLRPALVIQADRYNRRREAIIIAASPAPEGIKHFRARS